MDDQRLIYWLRLLTIDGISSEQAQALLAKVGLPEEIFNARLSTLREVVGEQLALKLRSGLTHEKELLVESTLHWLRETPKASFVALDDKNYPQSFLTSGSAPIAFFAVGDLSLLANATVSLVGSRHPDELGAELATQWAAKLSTCEGVSVVQTDKEGIELSAVRGVAKANTNALIWISSQPIANVQLQAKVNFVSTKGLIVSSVLPTKSSSDDFDQLATRALTLAAVNAFVVIQAGARSSILGMMREAGDLGREVMAVPGSVYSPLSKGCHQLIKQGASLVEGTDDVLKTLKLKKL